MADVSIATIFSFPKSLPRRVGLLLMALLIVNAGIAHFTNPDGFVAIMPPYVPAHLTLVYISGLFEILGGVGVLFYRTRRLAGWGLIALLIAVFPANLHMALNPELFPTIPAWALYVRLPLQFVFIAWVWWVTLTHSKAPPQDV